MKIGTSEISSAFIRERLQSRFISETSAEPNTVLWTRYVHSICKPDQGVHEDRPPVRCETKSWGEKENRIGLGRPREKGGEQLGKRRGRPWRDVGIGASGNTGPEGAVHLILFWQLRRSHSQNGSESSEGK